MLKGELLMTQRVITGFFLLIFILLPFGTSAGLLPALDTSSPYATMRSFHQEKQRIATLYEAYRSNPSDRTQRALIIAVRRAADQLLDMSNVPPATQTKVGARSLIELADIFCGYPILRQKPFPALRSRQAHRSPAVGPFPARSFVLSG